MFSPFGSMFQDEEYMDPLNPETRLLRVAMQKQEIIWKAKKEARQIQEILDRVGEYNSKFRRKFKIANILGNGAFGCVYHVHESLNYYKIHNFAIKRIPLPRSEKGMKAALREVEALVSFDHSGIVRFYDSWIEEPPEGWQREFDYYEHSKLNYTDNVSYNDDSAFLYIKMELCGSTLAKWLQNNENRELTRMINWFKQIVSAVGYIHKNGRIHRDLKPQNIFFAHKDRLKVGDLGIVTEEEKLLNIAEAERTFGMCTKKYMAPEQNGWTYYDNKVDIFALGLILAELFVKMNDDVAEKVFNNYREGIPNDILQDAPEVKKYVDWMTTTKYKDRPDCEEILSGTLFEGVSLSSPYQSEYVLIALGYFILHSDEQIPFLLLLGIDLMKRGEFLSKFEVQANISGPFTKIDDCRAYKAKHLVDLNIYTVKRIPIQARSRFSDDLFLPNIANIRHEGILGYYNSWIEKPSETMRWKRRTHDDYRDFGVILERNQNWDNYPPQSIFLYIQMEHCTETLAKWLKNHGERDLNHAKLRLKELLSAVGYLHRKSITHGNLNPNYIFIDEIGRLKIDPTIRPTTKIPHPSYLAPEQRSWHDRATPKSDIFSLGLIFVEMSTVMPPFKISEIFLDYRIERPNPILKNEPEKEHFVAWLTDIKPANRPECEEILKHDFLA